MKRKILPLSLTLITIVLAVLVLSFSNNRSESKYSPRLTDESSLVYGIKPSVEYLASIRNNQTTGVIAPENLNLVQNQLANLDGSRFDVDLRWRQLGPDNFGGRTRAIMFDNQDASAKTVYAAGVSGGIWKSLDLGVTWDKINSSNYNLNVSCMKQAENGTIYVGTGESFAAETVSGLEELGFTGGFIGQGMFKSDDGENFTLMPSTQPQFNDDESSWAFVNEIAVIGAKIYAATNTGLMYSNDNGNTWSTATDTAGVELNMNSFDVQVSSDGAVVACVDNECYISTTGDTDAFINRSTGDSVSLPSSNVGRIEFAFAPSDPNILYASVVNNSGSMKGLYRSDDKGQNWRIIQPNSSSTPIFVGQGIYDNALTVFPENPDKILVGGINAWEAEKIQEDGFFAVKSISTSQVPTFFPSYLHVDHHTYVFRPGTNNTFMIGTDGGVAIGNISAGEYEFQQANRKYFTTQFYSVGPSGDGNYVTGGAQDNGTILITGAGNTTAEGEEIRDGDGCATVVSVINKDIVVVSEPANDDGIPYLFRSEDAGVNYSGQFVGPINGDLDDEFFYTPIALWESFNNLNSRDSVMYHAKETIPGGTTIQVLSNNSGQPFYYTTPEDVTLNAGDSLNIQDLVSSRLFVASSNKVFMTSELHLFDKTPEWFEITNSNFGFIGDAQCIGVSNDANHIFVGTRDGKLFRISNLALAYDYDRADVNSPECIVSTQEIDLTIPGGSEITQVVTSVSVDPGNPDNPNNPSNNVMVTLGNYGNDHYVLYSTNALDETPIFESRQGNLPQMPIYSSVLEMTNNEMGILGTEHGIFVTEDISADNPDWVRQDSLMGSVPVFQLLQQRVSKTADTVTLVNGNEVIEIVHPGTNNYGVIYAATFGRGLLRCNVFQKPVGIEDLTNENPVGKSLSINVYPNPVSTYASLEFEAFNNGNADISVYDLSGRKAMALNNKVLKGINKFEINLSELQAGSYIIEIIVGTDVYTQKIIAN